MKLKDYAKKIIVENEYCDSLSEMESYILFKDSVGIISYTRKSVLFRDVYVQGYELGKVIYTREEDLTFDLDSLINKKWFKFRFEF